LCLTKNLTPLKLSQIGQIFDKDHSAVPHAVKRFEQKCKENNKVEQMKEKMIIAQKKD